MDSREAPLFLVLQGQLTVCYCPLQLWGRHSANPYGFRCGWYCCSVLSMPRIAENEPIESRMSDAYDPAWQERERERERKGDGETENPPLLISTYPMSFRGAYCLSNGCASRIPGWNFIGGMGAIIPTSC